MRRFITILVLLALAGSAWWCFGQLGGDGHPDGTGPTNGTAAANRDGEPAVAGGGAAGGGVAGGGIVGVGERTERVADAAPDVTLLEVLVVRTEDSEPIADVEVAAAAVERIGYRAVRATDAAGVAAFEVPAAATDSHEPRRIRVVAAGARAALVRLVPGTPRRVTLELSRRLFVEGDVVDAAGRPVAGAELVFLARPEYAGDRPSALRVGRNDEDGTFRVALFGGGFLGARHASFAPSPMIAVGAMAREPATDTARVRLTLLLPRSTVTGTVLLSDGTPAAGVEVQLAATPPARATARPGARLAAPPVGVMTDRDGAFSTAGLPPGPATFEALGENGDCARGRFTVRPGDPVTLRIQLAPPAVVQGRVRSAGEDRVHALVESGGPGQLLWSHVECGEDGSYVLAGLPGGPARLVAREIGRADASIAHRRAVRSLDLPPGATTTWNPVLEPLAGGRSLRGLVVDHRRRPLAGCAVLARQHEPARDIRVTTGEDGRFEIPCEAGSVHFDVMAWAPGRKFAGFPCVRHRDVDADSGMLLVEIDTSRRPATVIGVAQSKAGVGLPAMVSCWHREHQQTVRLAAGPDGAFRIGDIPPGSVILTFTHPGFFGPPREANLESGQRIDLGAIVLDHGSAVYGSVTNADGSAPEGVEISIHTAAEQLAAEYAGGSYRFDSVPAGRHRLLIHGPGIAASAHTIEITAGIDLVQDIAVAPGIARRIHVVDPVGTGGWVTLALRKPGDRYSLLVGQPLDGPGTVEFVACMAAGTYEAVAWDGEGRQGRSNVTFTAGAAAPVLIELEGR